MSNLSVNAISPRTSASVELQGINPPTYLGSPLAQVSNVVLKVGDTMTGPLVLPGNASTLLQAVPKQQLDSAISTLYGAGTFTPTLSFGGASVGITYSSQDGRWIRLGNVYTCAIYLVLTSKGSSTGGAAINGLPVFSNGIFMAPCSVDNMSLTFPMSCLTSSGTNSMTLRTFNGSSGDNITVTNTNFTNTTLIHITITYWT